ncbi:diguanylate cyclase (GGDEF)-like protein/PAS domain S-box-containing protein [Pseudacidovorax sp. 1753]|uniref:sensor domain-containing diguanylate cyclase n=1 Tax=Pseudacidovorax sp. 1753 TaxID=3156419 RepID=UPI003396440B
MTTVRRLMPRLGRKTPARGQAAMPAFDDVAWRLRASVVAVVALLAVAASVAIWLAVSHLAQRIARVSDEDHQRASTRATAEAMSSLQHQREAALAGTARMLQPAASDEERAQRFTVLASSLGTVFSASFLIDALGQPLARADEHGVQVMPAIGPMDDRSYFQEVMRTHKPVLSQPIAGRNTGRVSIVMALPVMDGQRVVAVVAGVLRLDSGDVGRMAVGRLPGAVRVVTDDQGQILSHDGGLALQRLPLSREARFAEAFEAWRAQGSPRLTEGFVTVAGGQVVAAVPVSETPWLIWQARPVSGLQGALDDELEHTLQWTLGAVLLAGLLSCAWIVWRLRPLGRLVRRVQRLTAPMADAQPGMGWPGGAGELGQLSTLLRLWATEQAGLAHAHAEIQTRLRAVLAAAPVGVAFVREGVVELASAECCRLFGNDAPQMLGRAAHELFEEADGFQRFLQAARGAAALGVPYGGDWRLRRSDGLGFWANLRSRPVDWDDLSLGEIWTVADVTEQKLVRQRLEWQSRHDPLTGAANRMFFDQRIARVMGNRELFSPAVLIFIDLDHFKPINDTAGHLAGDEVLKQVVQAIAAQSRSGDLVVRLGGDEFALLLEQCSGMAALAVAQRIRAAVQEIVVPWEEQELRVGASIGVAELTPDIRTAQDWVAAADAACYAAKTSGRNQVQMSPPRVVLR